MASPASRQIRFDWYLVEKHGSMGSYETRKAKLRLPGLSSPFSSMSSPQMPVNGLGQGSASPLSGNPRQLLAAGGKCSPVTAQRSQSPDCPRQVCAGTAPTRQVPSARGRLRRVPESGSATRRKRRKITFFRI